MSTKYRIRAVSWILAFSLLSPLLPGSPSPSGDMDWPNWRGPNQDGISRETGFLKSWPADGLQEIWRIPLGTGFSSFAAVGERLYTETEKDGRQLAVCLNALTGATIWSRDLEPGYRERQGGDGPRATPAVKDGIVYALGATGTLAALRESDGEPIWKLNILEKFNAKKPQWGLSASPFLQGDLLIVPVGAGDAPVVAFHRRTGTVEWRSGSDGRGDLAGYSTPCAIPHGGRKQIIVLQGRALVSLEPESGQVLWSYPWQTSFDVNAAAPIYHEGKLFISSGYDHGAALLELPEEAGGKPREVWQIKGLRNKFSSCVLHQGYLYGFDETRLKCVEFSSGEEKWARSGFGFGSVLLAEGHLIILGGRGDLALALATPGEYQERARMDKVLRGRSWTVPVLHKGVLYLRDLKEAVALKMK